MGSEHWHWLEFILGVLAAAYSVTCTRPCCRPETPRREVKVPRGCHSTQHPEFRYREHCPPRRPTDAACWCHDPGEPPRKPHTMMESDMKPVKPDAGKPWKPGGHY